MKTKNKLESIYFVNCGITDSVELFTPIFPSIFESSTGPSTFFPHPIPRSGFDDLSWRVPVPVMLLVCHGHFSYCVWKLSYWLYGRNLSSKSTIHQGKGRKHAFWFMAQCHLGFELIIQSPWVAFTWYWKQFLTGVSLGGTEILNVLVCFYLRSSPEFTQFLRALNSSAAVDVTRY